MRTDIQGFAQRVLRWLALALFLGAWTAMPGLAQEGEVPEPAAKTEEADAEFAAPVIIDGNDLFTLRGSSALPANERAEMVQERIIEVAEASDSPTVIVNVRETELGPTIYADGKIVTMVTEADSEHDQMEISLLAELQAHAVEEAIINYRKERSQDSRIGGFFKALGWTALFAAYLFGLFQVSRWLRRLIPRFVRKKLVSVEAATNEQVQADAISALIRFVAQFALVATGFLGLYYYLTFVLFAFAETRALAQLLLTYVTEPVISVVFGFIRFLPSLITLAIIALFTRYVIKGIRIFFDAVEAGTFIIGDFEKHWIAPTYNIIRILVILIAIVFAFPYIPGSDSAAFQGITILIGAMLSLGSNSVVGNVLSGLFVVYRRSTNIGDRIRVGEHTGDVVEIKLMETHLKSIKNELVSIPNAQLLNSEVVNYSRKIDGNGLLLHTTVGIGYEEPSEKVEAMLIEASRRTEGLKNRPEPFVLFTGLAAYAINYQINAYSTRGASFPKILSELHRNIVAVFNENGVQIMTPSYIADPDSPKIATEDWDGQLAGADKG